MTRKFKRYHNKQVMLLTLLSLTGFNISALNLFATGGMGANSIYDHNTTQYKFKPAAMDVSVLAGLGLETAVNNYSNIGLGFRYIYNDAGGDVNTRTGTARNTNYTNKIHNLLTTLEGRVEPFRISNSRLTYGVRGGVGVNTYRMQLSADNVGRVTGLNIDPERSWKHTPAGLVGFVLTKNRDGYGVSGSLDYIYLGKQTSNKTSRTFASNNLTDEVTYHNHNFVFSLTYTFKDLV